MYGTLFIIVLVIGIASFFIYSINDYHTESWKIKTPELTSCELIIKSTMGNLGKFGYDKNLIQYERVWNESNCDDPKSKNWKGDEWRYVAPAKTNEDKIEKVKRYFET